MHAYHIRSSSLDVHNYRHPKLKFAPTPLSLLLLLGGGGGDGMDYWNGLIERLKSQLIFSTLSQIEHVCKGLGQSHSKGVLLKECVCVCGGGGGGGGGCT